ncbi:endonuclease domain-containing protein [Gordonia sp. NPDC003425]
MTWSRVDAAFGTMSIVTPHLGPEHDDRWRGVYSWAELSRRGFTQSQLRRLISGGDLCLLRRGWYATHWAHPWVVEAVRAGGVCSCVTALDVHGVWVKRGARHLHVRRRKTADKVGAARFCRQFGPPRPEVYPLDDIPTALRHALRCLDDEGIVAACESILHQGLLEFDDLTAVFLTAPVRLRRLLDRCDERVESGTESIFKMRMIAMGIDFRIQVEIVGIGRVDFLIGRRLIIEIDSVEFHDKSREQRERDRTRDARAIALGYLPLRFSYRQVMFEWDEVAETVTAVVRRRDHMKKPVRDLWLGALDEPGFGDYRDV